MSPLKHNIFIMVITQTGDIRPLFEGKNDKQNLTFHACNKLKLQ